ncbi:MAG: Uma2 family endonuclease, partial [Anaerolineae bacterium]
YLDPRLQGLRLSGRFYTPIPSTADGALISDELGLILRPEKEMLRLVDPSTGRAIPTAAEAMAQAQAEALRAQTEARRAQTETQRAQIEAQRADRAEAELARVQAELALLRAQAQGE